MIDPALLVFLVPVLIVVATGYLNRRDNRTDTRRVHTPPSSRSDRHVDILLRHHRR